MSVLRLAGFDTLQSTFPRVRAAEPVVIVAIDEASLANHGQWPWPRTTLARLITTIAAADPAAIGIDILMPEPDRLSPERLSSLVSGMDPDLGARLRRLPSNDAVLAEAVRKRPIVVGVAGLESVQPTAVVSGLRAPPLRVFGGEDPRPFFRRFVAALKNVEEIDRAAPGHGLVGVDLDRGVARRVPLAAAVGSTIMPTIGLEMLRLARGESTVIVHAGPRGIRAVGVGDLLVPTQPDGSVWLRYSRHDPARFVSASDVLSGKVDARAFKGMFVLIGVSAFVLSDNLVTPVGDRMPGVEIHAQLLEAIFGGGLLSRPRWVVWLEAATLVAGGLVLVWTVPALPVRASVLLLLPVISVPVGLALFFYHKQRVVYDAASPAVGLAIVFTAMLSVALASAESQRRTLREQLAQQREAAARVAGELEAARRIQMGSLPRPGTAFPGEQRFDLYAFLEPAREVGGDLYDFFALDADRICLFIGDVSGKGLPGSLFMAMSKSAFKSIALGRAGDVGAMMREADREISRDNGEGLFVTVWAAVLNVARGDIEYCNAGHDPPYVVLRRGRALERLDEGGGPPLCVLDAFPYVAASHRLSPDETLCLVTDGVVEATSPSGEFYGRQRLEALLAGLTAEADVTEVGEAIRRDVARFAAGVEPADDLAILVLRWNGPGVVRERVRIFPARMSALPEVGAFTADVCQAAGLGGDPILRLTLLVEELFTNTVTHGHGGDSDEPVRLAFAVEPGRIAMTYEDTGPPHDPFADLSPPATGVPVEDRPVGGLGVPLVAAMASDVKYRRSEGRNQISLAISTPA